MIVIFDIDGVVIKSGKIVYQIYDIFKELSRKNILYTFATGRSYLRCIEAIGEFRPTVPLILENGSKLLYPDGTVMLTYPLKFDSIEYTKRALYYYKEHIEFACFSSHDNLQYIFYSPSETFDIDTIHHCTLTNNIDEFSNLALDNDCTQITIKLKNIVGSSISSKIIESSEGTFVHIKEKGVNKGAAVEVLARHLSISLDDIIVVGNDANDIEMFHLKVRGKICIKGNILHGIDMDAYNVVNLNHDELLSYINNL